MRLQYLSDLHLERGPMDVPITDADVVVRAGDIHRDGKKAIGWASNFPQDVIYVLGNHEFYSGDSIVELPDGLRDYSELFPHWDWSRKIISSIKCAAIYSHWFMSLLLIHCSANYLRYSKDGTCI